MAAPTQDLLFKILVNASAAAAIAEFAALNKEFESLKLTLDTVLGSQEATAAALEHLSTVADFSGQSFLELSKEYAQFAAASKGTALEGAATMEVFDSVSLAMGRLGKTTTETHRVFVALSQMMAKGQVYAEEWRGQLGESLPLANEAVRVATGLTTAEFNKMMEAGQLLAVDVLPVLASGLRELVPADAADMVDNLSASLNRFDNAVVKSFISPGQEGLSSAFAEIVDVGTIAITNLTGATVAFGKNLGATAAFIDGTIPTWDEYNAAIQENRDSYLEFSKSTEDAVPVVDAFAKKMAEAAAISLKAASDYTQLLTAAKESAVVHEKNRQAVETAAKATSLYASILSDTGEALKLESTAATDTAVSTQALADAHQNTLNIITQRKVATEETIVGLEALKIAEAGQAEQIDKQLIARKQQLDALDKATIAQQAVTDKAIALAQAEEFAAIKAKLASDTYGDQSANIEILSKSVADAELAVTGLTATQEAAKVASEGLEAAEQALSKSKAENTDLINASILANDAEAAAIVDVARESLAAQATVDELSNSVKAASVVASSYTDAQRNLEVSTIAFNTAQTLANDGSSEAASKLDGLRASMESAQTQVDTLGTALNNNAGLNNKYAAAISNLSVRTNEYDTATRMVAEGTSVLSREQIDAQIHVDELSNSVKGASTTADSYAAAQRNLEVSTIAFNTAQLLANDGSTEAASRLDSLRTAMAAAQAQVDTLGAAVNNNVGLNDKYAAAIANLTALNEKYEAVARKSAEGTAVSTTELAKLGQEQLNAQRHVDDLKNKIAEGIVADKDATAARTDLAVATAKLNDALEDLAKKKEAELKTAELLTDSIADEGDLRATNLQNLAKEAEARGDLVEAVELEIKALESEADTLKDVLAAKQEEVIAAEESAAAKLESAKASGVDSLAYQGLKEEVEKTVATKKLEVAETQESIRAKLEEIKSLQNTAAEIALLTAEIERNIAAMERSNDASLASAAAGVREEDQKLQLLNIEGDQIDSKLELLEVQLAEAQAAGDLNRVYELKIEIAKTLIEKAEHQVKVAEQQVALAKEEVKYAEAQHKAALDKADAYDKAAEATYRLALATEKKAKADGEVTKAERDAIAELQAKTAVLEGETFAAEAAADAAAAAIEQTKAYVKTKEAQVEVAKAGVDAAEAELDSTKRLIDAEKAATAEKDRNTAAVERNTEAVKKGMTQKERDAEFNARQMARFVAEMEKSQAAVEAGTLGVTDYITNLYKITGRFNGLNGDAQVFVDAIAEAKQAMEDFAESAVQGLQDLQEEWMQLNDQQIDLMLLEQQNERIKIETELAKAKKDGNDAAIAALTEQLTLIDQIHAKQLANLAEKEAKDAIKEAADAARDAARWANLSAEEQANENALTNLEDQLAAAILARDDLAKQSILDQIAAENIRHDQVMSNLSAEQKAIAGNVTQADATAPASGATTGATTGTGATTDVVKTVQMNFVLPNGNTAKVNVLPGQEDTMHQLLTDLFAAKAVAA